MICEPDNGTFLYGSDGRILDPGAALFIDDTENGFQGLAGGFVLFPPGERFGDGIEEFDTAPGIGDDDSVANAGESDVESFSFNAKLFLSQLLVGDIAGNS